MIVGIFGALTKFVRANDFNMARAAIDSAAPNINYSTFCQTLASGEDKLACRIESVPTVGFLVCKQPTLDGAPCNEVIMTELNNIVQVANSGVPTVTVNPPQINDVMCGQNDSTDCSGFLETWVVDGGFQQIRDHIVHGTVEDLINQVQDFTNMTGWPTTANSLMTIVNYMNVNPGQNAYRQICDLQGFFLQSGGFLVADVPAIEENIGINGMCYDGEPTTQQVLSALNSMIMALGGETVGNGEQNSAILTTSTVWILCLEILVVTIFYIALY